MRHFDNWIDSYIEYTSGQETVEKVHRWVAISTIAAALERKVWMDRGHYELLPNMYVFIIGKSGIVRKSTSTSIGVDLLRELGSINIMSERLTAASFIEQLQESGKGFEHNGLQHRHSPVFCYASELKVFLEEVYGSTVGLLTTLYDPLKMWSYKSKKDGEIKIFGPCINILAASTPQWLAEEIPVSQMEGGFASRIVFVVVTGMPRRFVAHPRLDASKREMRKKLVEDLRHIHELTGEVKQTPAAWDWYEDWYARHMKAIVDRADDAKFSGYYARKSDLLIKVAMVIAIAQDDHLTIDIPHYEQAEKYLEEIEETMLSAFGQTGKNMHSQELHRINALIQRRGEVTHALLLQHYCQDMNHRQLQDVMATLINMNAVIFYTENGKVIYKAARPTSPEQPQPPK